MLSERRWGIEMYSRKAYINGILLDGTKDMTPREGMVIIEENGIIKDILSKEDTGVAELKDCEIVNLNGCYIMPGLINMHAHIPGSGKISKGTSDTKKVVDLVLSNKLTRAMGHKIYEKYAKQALYSGVTTLRSLAGIDDFDTHLRNKVERGEADGPRILASNMAISVPGGHMAGSLAYEAHSEQEVRALVKLIARDKPDLIKLMITGGVLDAEEAGTPGVMKMPENYVRAACKEAHSMGLPVAAHVESLEGVKVALRNGVDTIEHGATLDDEAIELFKESGAADIETIIPTLYFAKLDPEFTQADEKDKINGDIVFNGVTNCARQCLENGIPVGLGIDSGCPFSPQYNLWRELVCMVKYVGVSNNFALHTATLVNAQIAGIDKCTGSIEMGKCADFVVTKENPLENLEALREPMMVVARGKIYDDIKIKKFKDIETILDGFLKV